MKYEEFLLLPKPYIEFAKYKKSIQGLSVKTVDEYMLDLRLFGKYLVLSSSGKRLNGENFDECDISHLTVDDFAAVTTSQIYDFLYYLDTEREDSNKTKARKLSAVKGFYKYLTVKKNYFEYNPAANIESPKLKKQLPKHLTVDESIILLETVASDRESKNRERDYAMLTLFLNCGMRLSELAGIDMRDIDHEMRSLRVTGKGSKERIIYLNDACRAALGDYMSVRFAAQTKPGESALFISSRGTRISNKTVQHVVYKYLDASGLGNKGYSTHKLRHTAATLMYQTGKVDIRVLKDILGHEQLNTTQIYTHVSDKGMEAAMNNNPLSEIMPKKEKNLPSNTKE